MTNRLECRWGGRAPLNVAISVDGKTWKAALSPETGPYEAKRSYTSALTPATD
ncbi:MAG TPA: hypothetical protein VFV58_21135 [Blastocatellia bacterium]|nr:hypothetical protein [Blastocatellia bacterium]